MEKTYKKRCRVNYSISTKNVVTCETTFEGIDMSNEDVIKEATLLFDMANQIAKERTEKYL